MGGKAGMTQDRVPEIPESGQPEKLSRKDFLNSKGSNTRCPDLSSLTWKPRTDPTAE
jgi:hypothetical protein